MNSEAPLRAEKRYRKSERKSNLDPVRIGLRGRVVKWIETRGFGFIQHGDYHRDIFVHVKNLAGYPAIKDLIVNQEVGFDVAETDKGVTAINVYPIS